MGIQRGPKQFNVDANTLEIESANFSVASNWGAFAIGRYALVGRRLLSMVQASSGAKGTRMRGLPFRNDVESFALENGAAV